MATGRKKTKEEIEAEIDRDYIIVHTWPVRNRWQGRLKFKAAFINECGFNKKALKKLGIGPQYRYADVSGPTEWQVQRQILDLKPKMIKRIRRMLRNVNKKDGDGQTDFWYKVSGMYWGKEDLYRDPAEWTEEEDGASDNDQYGTFDEGGKRRSKRIKQKKLEEDAREDVEEDVEEDSEEDPEEAAARWAQQLIKQWDDMRM